VSSTVPRFELKWPEIRAEVAAGSADVAEDGGPHLAYHLVELLVRKPVEIAGLDDLGEIGVQFAHVVGSTSSTESTFLRLGLRRGDARTLPLPS